MKNVFKAMDRFGNETEFEVVKKTAAAEREIDMQYRIAFNEALKYGLMPREKMRSIMSDREMWSEADETELKNVLARLAMGQTNLHVLENSGKKDECIKVAEEMFSDRNKMWQLLMIQQSAFVNSAEGMAETIKYEATMCATLVVKATGARYWKTYSDYVTERDENETSTVIENLQKAYTVLGIEERDELLSEYPERKWVKHKTEEIMAESSALEDEAERIVKTRKKAAAKKITKKKAKKKASKKNG
jgi:hypothetical protein